MGYSGVLGTWQDRGGGGGGLCGKRSGAALCWAQLAPH